MTVFSVDVENDGPCPGKHSMTQFGAVRIDDELTTTFGAKLKPISDIWVPEALAISGYTREQTMEFDDPTTVMQNFEVFILTNTEPGTRPIFVSDNNGYDFGWINYYFHWYLDRNPFGHSSRRIGDFYCGLRKNFRASGRDWHKLRKTKHTHDPVDDAKGNAEALIAMCKNYGVQLPGVTNTR
jgi:hypothetical protein